MSQSESRRRLKAVDSNLNIIPGGRHGNRRANHGWEKTGGPICSNCGQEYFRGHEGLCYSCWEQAKDNEIEIRDRTGISHWLPMSIINQITHLARKKQ